MEKTDQIPEVMDNMRRLFQAVAECSRAAEAGTELTGPQLWALKILARNSTLRVSELARHMFLRPATVVGIVDRLEGKGLVTRTRSQVDRRAVDLELTPVGRALVESAPEVAQMKLINGLDELSDLQFDQVREGMRLLVRIFGAEALVPQPLHS